MEKESAISQFTYLPQSKSERELFINMCIEEVLSGNRNPLELEIMLKNLEDTINAIRKNQTFTDCVMNEVDKYPEKTFAFKGVKITKTVRRTYDFSVCGDSEYDELIEEQAAIKEKIKAREEFLKTLKPEFQIADAKTGNILNCPLIYTTEGISVKLPD